MRRIVFHMTVDNKRSYLIDILNRSDMSRNPFWWTFVGEYVSVKRI